MTTHTLPSLDEFIDLEQRRRQIQERQHLESDASVGVYGTRTGKVTLTIRISARKVAELGLTTGTRYTPLIHQNATHIALKPAQDGGAKLTRRKGGSALIYQTTIARGVLDMMPARAADMAMSIGGVLMIALREAEPAVTSA